MFQTQVVWKIKKHILCSVTLFRQSALYEIMWKRAGQATDDSIAHAHFMVDTEDVTLIAFPLQ
jgi:hypothetical protein